MRGGERQKNRERGRKGKKESYRERREGGGSEGFHQDIVSLAWGEGKRKEGVEGRSRDCVTGLE